MPSRDGRELADSLLSLYNVNVSDSSMNYHQVCDDIITKLYAPDATFEDPFVILHGRENIIAHFRARAACISSSRATLIRGSLAGGAVLTMSSDMFYGFKPIPRLFNVQMKITTVCEMKRGKILAHYDSYDFVSVLENVPFVRFFYSHMRRIIGQSTAIVLRKILPTVPKMVEYNTNEQKGIDMQSEEGNEVK